MPSSVFLLLLANCLHQGSLCLIPRSVHLSIAEEKSMISPTHRAVHKASSGMSDDITLLVCMKRADYQLSLALARDRVTRLFSWMGGMHEREGRDGLVSKFMVLTFILLLRFSEEGLPKVLCHGSSLGRRRCRNRDAQWQDTVLCWGTMSIHQQVFWCLI